MKEEIIFSCLDKQKGIEITAATDGKMWGYSYSITTNTSGSGCCVSNMSFETKEQAILKALVLVKDRLKKFENVFGAKKFYKFYEDKTQLNLFSTIKQTITI